MAIGKYKKILLYFVISTISSLLLTFSFSFFLDRHFKKNIFIEIQEPYRNQNFVFYNNENNNIEQQNVDFYKVLDEAESVLLSTNPFSEVYKLNLSEQDYKIQNERFYNILDICKTVYYCSEKNFAPMVYDDILEENTNITNFDCILINKNKIRKLYPKTRVNLDQFIDAYCLEKIINTNKNLKNFYLQKDEEIYVSGDQNRFMKGWNLEKKIIMPQKITLKDKDDDNIDINLDNIDINELDKKIEKLIMKMKDEYINIQSKKFDFLTFAQRTNATIDLLNTIALKFKTLKTKHKKQDKHNKNNERVVSLKFRNIKNKAISIIEGKNINKIIKKQYALQENNKKEKYYNLKNYFVNAKTRITSEPSFVIGFVFTDDNIFAKVLAKAFVIDNFENTKKIINKLRYYGCLFLFLYMDEYGNINFENSIKIKVKKIDNDYEFSFYE